MSSRNVYLSPEERRIAPVFYRSLVAGREAIERGVLEAGLIEARMKAVVAAESAITIDYLACCDPATLEPLAKIVRDAVLLGAIRLGSVRLIDNLLVRRKRGRR